MPKIIVTTTPKNRILINTKGGAGGGVETFRQLKDVDATNLNDGETVVYDVASDKFKVETLPIVNGGEF
jgi:hypothetical protein